MNINERPNKWNGFKLDKELSDKYTVIYTQNKNKNFLNHFSKPFYYFKLYKFKKVMIFLNKINK